MTITKTLSTEVSINDACHSLNVARATFYRHRPVMLSQDAPRDILINTGSKRQIDLVGNMWTAPGRITQLHLNNRTDQIGCRTFRTRFIFLFW